MVAELGLKARKIDGDWISKSQAIKISPKEFGRRRLETAIEKGLVKKKPAQSRNTQYSAILVSKKDVENQIKNSTLL
jgi:hypothetical protein